ncbi:MAG: hypothetical protein PVG89_04430, partial [Gammaproteobacteria bacterium]
MHYKTTGTSAHKDVAPTLYSVLQKTFYITITKNSILGVTTAAVLFTALPTTVIAEAIGPLTPEERAIQARKLRTDAAQDNFLEPLPEHPVNGDETAYPTQINSYTKGLPHDPNGIV